METRQQKKTWGMNFFCMYVCKGEYGSVWFVLLFFSITWMLAGNSPYALAQVTTVTLGGRVVDPQEHVIRGADVAVISEDTGVTTHAKTNESGLWQINSLIAGHYRFIVRVSGFETLEHTMVDLQIGDVKSIDVQMKIGSVDAQVVVSSETPLIDTTAAVSGVVLDSSDMEQLPSASGSPLDLASLAPGVYLAPPSGGGTLWANIALSAFSVNGSGRGTYAVNYVLDGATDTIVSTGQISFIPPSYAVSQTRVQTNSYDASIGRTAAGTINMSLKSGTKKFHGVLYERIQNNFFDANMAQYKNKHQPLPMRHFNEYGGTVGGPVWIPKFYDGKKRGTFFFLSYDGVRSVAPIHTSQLSIPTMDERKGDFSKSIEVVNKQQYNVVIYDPLTINAAGNRKAFPFATIPPERISPMAKALTALLPVPNVPDDQRDPQAGTDTNDYQESDPEVDRFYSLIVRIDQNWNNSHHSYIDWRRNQLRNTTNDNFGPGNILADENLNRDNYGLTVNHTWVINPSSILTINANVTQYKYYYASLAASVDPTQYGFSQTFANSQLVRGVPEMTGVLGLDSIGDVYGPTRENDYQWEVRGFMTQILGTHSFRYGGEWLLSKYNIAGGSGQTGSYDFDTKWTQPNPNSTNVGGSYQVTPAFLLGLPSSGHINQATKGFWTQPFVGAFVQDDWRATPRLTLDLGVRWDIQLGLTERHNRYFSRIDPNANLAPITNYAQSRYAAAIQGSPSSNSGIAYLQHYRNNVADFQAKGALQYAGVNGVSRYVGDLQFKYIQPRIGFAYAFSPTTVIHGGIGRFVQATFPVGQGSQSGYSTETPFVASNDNYYTQAATLDNPFPNGLVTPTGNSLGSLTSAGQISSFYDSNTKRPYTDDMSFRLQQQARDYIFEIAGVFDRTQQLPVSYQIDNPSLAAWHAAYDSQFTSTGAPVVTLPGDVVVTNPFMGAPYVTSTLASHSTVSAFQLSRPNPLVNGMTETRYNGSSTNYALQTRVQRRYRNGFGIITTFVWGKKMDKTAYFTPSVYSQALHRQLSTSDRRFQLGVAPTYVLPFGRGKLIGSRVSHRVNTLIGGWQLTTVYNFNSGTPIALPTNTALFQGGDPADGINKSRGQWFNTSKFAAFPLRNTTLDDLGKYPAWTGIQGLPGASYVPKSITDLTQNGIYQDFKTRISDNPTTYGTVRNPYYNHWNIGLTKTFPIVNSMRLEIRADAFNALNHPQFGSVDVDPSDFYFGWIGGSPTHVQINDPRVIQFAARIYY